MPILPLEPNLNLYYDTRGEGQPVVFLAGWAASSRTFEDQLDRFSKDHLAIAIDYRAHGRSTQTLTGHSLAGYARDVQAFLVEKDLHRVVLAGHSMGGFVACEYLRQFGADRLAAFVNIDQPPCDSRRFDWPHGDDLFEACRFVMDLQEGQREASRQLLDLVFKGPATLSDVEWMLPEMLRVPAPVAGVMYLDDIAYDARPILTEITIPTMFCWGEHSAMVPRAARDYIAHVQPDAHVVVFEESGHCPFLEEPEHFHLEVSRFIAGLN